MVSTARWLKGSIRMAMSRIRSLFGEGGGSEREPQVANLAARLGFAPDARLLIVHADDLGLAHAVNASFFDALKSGLVNSGSAMVPCTAFAEIAEFACAHPEADIGLHLTLTSDRGPESWAPVAPRDQVRSLIDSQGWFHQRWTSDTPIDPKEVEVELRAQVEKARAAGLRPTHLDSHQFRLQLTGSELARSYLRVARAYRLPALLTRGWLIRYPYLQSIVTPQDVLLDRIAAADATVKPEEWPEFYRRALKSLPSGVSQMTIHPGYDGPELRASLGDRQGWGPAWRQRDFDYFTSKAFRTLLDEEKITLITWRRIAATLAQEGEGSRVDQAGARANTQI